MMHHENLTEQINEGRPLTVEQNDIFEACPVCESKVVAKLRPDWQGFGPISIVGCGNPWHYATKLLGEYDG
jgi:cbb3-type cytochrome oxidase cytochrome c subunit